MDRNRALIVVAAALLGVGLLQMANAQSATQSDLQRAVLTAEEIGDGFVLHRSEPFLSDGTPSLSTSFNRSAGLTVESILIMLHVGVLDVDLTIDAMRQAVLMRPMLYTSPAPAPPIGMDTQRLRISGTLSQTPVSGDVIAWRYGDVKAVIMVLTTGTRSAQPYAERQQAKLVATLGAAAPVAAVPPAAAGAAPPVAAMQAVLDLPYRGLLTCGSFTHQEAAQVVLLAYPSDPYGLDGDGNGLACEDLPFVSDAEPIRAITGPASPPQEAAATPAPTLFEARGQGGSETDSFQVLGRVEVCWEITGRSPSGTIGAQASFIFYLSGRQASANSVTSKTGSGCQFLNLPAGTYYIKVIATSWSEWRVTVRRA